MREASAGERFGAARWHDVRDLAEAVYPARKRARGILYDWCVVDTFVATFSRRRYPVQTHYTLKPAPIATNSKVFIGIDAHKNSLTFVVKDVEGQTIAQRTTEHSRKHVEALIQRLPDCEIEAAYEAGPTGYTLCIWLEELGVDVKVVAPSLVPVRHGKRRVKTDKRDAEKLAQLLWAGLLESIHVHSPEGYRHRELIRTREQIRDHRTALGRQIKSKLLFHGIEIPEEINAKDWTKAFVDWLESGPTECDVLNATLGCLTKAWRDMKAAEAELKLELRSLAEEHYAELFELLTSVPGIGLIWAMTLILEIGDWTRFPTAKSFTGYNGLAPGAYNSGETERSGPLLKMGNKRVRTALVEASWSLIRKDAQKRELYEELKDRTTPHAAIVGIGRRLGLAIRAMVRDGTPYEYVPLEQGQNDEQLEETDRPAPE